MSKIKERKPYTAPKNDLQEAPTVEIGQPSEESNKNNTTDIKSFHYLEDGSIDFSILSTKYTRKKLDSGVYGLGWKAVGGRQVIDLKQTDPQENYNSEMDHYFSDKMENIYRAFFDEKVKNNIRKLGYKHKFGVLLYGKQGTGKTTMLRKYFERITSEHNGIVFIFNTYGDIDGLWDFIQKVRVIQHNPIICFMDEIDQPFLYNDFEREFKVITDGMKSIDNCMFLMATNYLDKIPKTIRERPSRVKYCIEVNGIEDKQKIRKFLETNLEAVDISYDLTDKELTDLKGSTLDELKQWLLDKVMELPVEKPMEKTVGFNKS